MTASTHESSYADGTGAVRAWSGLRYAYREMLERRLIVISISISCIVALFFTVAGPGGQILPQSLRRAAFFGSIAALSWPFGHGLATVLLYFVRLCRPYQVVSVAIAGGLYAAANIAMVGYAMYGLMLPDGPEVYGWPVYFLRAAVASLVHIGLIYYLACQRAKLRPFVDGARADDDSLMTATHANAAVAVDSTPPTATPGVQDRQVTANAGTGHAAPQEEGTSAVPSPPTAKGVAELGARFLDRLPAALGRDVLYLKVTGHYINVVTTGGSGALLMRFADAVAELGDAGMQVHRSFWVAYRHISGLARRGERTVVCLVHGEEVPVSRTFVAAVRTVMARKRID